MKKVTRVRSDIESRHTQGHIVTRFLSCGHAQVEMSGGKAREATWAYCFECTEKKAFDAAVSPAFRAHPPEPVEGR